MVDLPSVPRVPVTLPPLASGEFAEFLLVLPTDAVYTVSAISLSMAQDPSAGASFLPALLDVSMVSKPPPYAGAVLAPADLGEVVSSVAYYFGSSLVVTLPPCLVAVIFLLCF